MMDGTPYPYFTSVTVVANGGTTAKDCTDETANAIAFDLSLRKSKKLCPDCFEMDENGKCQSILGNCQKCVNGVAVAHEDTQECCRHQWTGNACVSECSFSAGYIAPYCLQDCCDLSGPVDRCGNPTPVNATTSTVTHTVLNEEGCCVEKTEEVCSLDGDSGTCTQSCQGTCSERGMCGATTPCTSSTECESGKCCCNGTCTTDCPCSDPNLCQTCEALGCGGGSCANKCVLSASGNCATECTTEECPVGTALAEYNGMCVCMPFVCGENSNGQSGAQASLVCCKSTYMKEECGQDDNPLANHVWVGDGFGKGDGTGNYCCCSKNDSEACCQASGANRHLIGGVCDECPVGTIYDANTQTCIECNVDIDCKATAKGNKCYNHQCYCVWDETPPYTSASAPCAGTQSDQCMVVKDLTGSDYGTEYAMCASCGAGERLLSKYISGPDKSAVVCCPQMLTRCCMVTSCSTTAPFCSMPVGNGTICGTSETCPTGTKAECGGFAF